MVWMASNRVYRTVVVARCVQRCPGGTVTFAFSGLRGRSAKSDPINAQRTTSDHVADRSLSDTDSKGKFRR